MKKNNDIDQIKENLGLKDLGFKTAFKATMGFYTAQFVASILGLITLASIPVFIYLAYKVISYLAK